jgi:hypothetical protein
VHRSIFARKPVSENPKPPTAFCDEKAEARKLNECAVSELSNHTILHANS